MKLKNLIVLALIVTGSSAFAQKLKLVEGDLKPLKGEKSILIEFSYDSMKIGEDDPEEAHVKKMTDRWNSEQAGKGDEWKQNWYDSRTKLYEPSFRYSFLKASGISTKSETNVYKIVVRTIVSEPGFHVPGIAAKAAWIYAEASIVKVDDPTNLVARIALYKYKSDGALGGDFGVVKRLQEAYISAAADLGEFIKTKTSK